MNYGKLTAGTTKTAIDTAKPSEKREIIPSLSRMGDVLHDIQEWHKFTCFRLIIIHAVSNSDKADIMFAEHDLCVEACFKVIAPNAAHIFCQNHPDFPSLYICNHVLPSGTVKVSAAPSVIRIMFAVSETMLISVVLQITLLIDNGVAFSIEIIIPG